MTNRKWMLEQNEYDLLMRVNEFVQHLYDPDCVLEPIATESWWKENGPPKCKWNCKACIQRWLNEERR